ncbi:MULTISPECIES: DUF4229 domain-containing protein [Rhodococcus]|uniref:DUF4229 domain-containing protein n=1 Tax=Rhodococcus pseudokoreensis TaxID=2811421 RepID=A0A974VY22_9NOCA|nr:MULTISPECIES: DUF4229 domain-containing protein [Rhodococcus]QSE87629.1 DUF4229 domain-containing protein [Rhodococcus pseudokoreensis]
MGISAMRHTHAPDAGSSPQPGSVTTRHLVQAIGVYAIARLLLVAVVAAAIMAVGPLIGRDVDFLIAAVFAVLISMPLSLAVFAAQRKKVNATIAAFDAQRTASAARTSPQFRKAGRRS